jgi:hypothetical protein
MRSEINQNAEILNRKRLLEKTSNGANMTTTSTAKDSQLQ